MGKKNPYIMTIGFDKNIDRHVQVADMLNSMARKKAQYIVDAVLAYHQMQEQGIVPVASLGMDYNQIKSIVLQILSEQGRIKETNPATYEQEVEESDNIQQENFLDFDAESLDGIMQSIAAFRD